MLCDDKFKGSSRLHRGMHPSGIILPLMIILTLAHKCTHFVQHNRQYWILQLQYPYCNLDVEKNLSICCASNRGNSLEENFTYISFLEHFSGSNLYNSNLSLLFFVLFFLGTAFLSASMGSTWMAETRKC